MARRATNFLVALFHCARRSMTTDRGSRHSDSSDMFRAQRTFRRHIHFVHKWLGLTMGPLFAILGLTGSLLTFYPEIDLLLNPSLRARSPAVNLSITRIHEVLRSVEPRRNGAWRIELPPSETSPIAARYYKPTETEHRVFAPLIVTLDPNTFEVTSRRFWGEEPLTWLYDLHYTLLLGDDGRTILGACSILLFLLLASGAYLWWPNANSWRAAFRMKSGATWIRRVYDLHTRPGICGFPLLTLLTLTGLILVVPKWFTPALDTISPLTKFYDGPFQAARGALGVGADEAVGIARKYFPDAEVRWIETPGTGRPVWRVQLRQEREPNKRFPRTNVWIDANSGAVLAIRDPTRNGNGDTLMDWLHPLHNGEAFGIAGRLIALICGFLPALALVTGYVRWRHKVIARRKSRGIG